MHPQPKSLTPKPVAGAGQVGPMLNEHKPHHQRTQVGRSQRLGSPHHLPTEACPPPLPLLLTLIAYHLYARPVQEVECTRSSPH